MEEVEDIIPEDPQEFPEEVEEISIPEPPPLKRATNKLKDKVTCEGCGKSLSLHAYKYSHKCKARAPDEQPKEVNESKKQEDAPDAAQEARLAQLTEALKAPRKAANSATAGGRAAMSNAQSQRPIRQKTVIQRTPEYIPEPPYQPTQQEIYQHLIQQRQQQAYMRHQAMLAPYQNMFASRAR